MKRLDVMTDIETLGTSSDSTIIQISAIAFDINTQEFFDTFNQTADIEKNDNFLKVDGSTLKWWLKTDKQLLTDLLLSGTVSSEELLINFHGWLTTLCKEYDVYLWGNGILFDNKIIQHQLNALGMKYPIYYRNDRDVRTLVDLASKKLGITEEELKKKFDDDNLTKHNAFDDVIYQIRLASYCYNVLTDSLMIWKLNRYNLNGREEVVFEHEDADTVAKKAIELSSQDPPYTHSYRMEAWQNGKMIGKWRFFQSGREFTEDILKSLLNSQ